MQYTVRAQLNEAKIKIFYEDVWKKKVNLI